MDTAKTILKYISIATLCIAVFLFSFYTATLTSNILHLHIFDTYNEDRYTFEVGTKPELMRSLNPKTGDPAWKQTPAEESVKQ